jgi:hypothetical protein
VKFNAYQDADSSTRSNSTYIKDDGKRIDAGNTRTSKKDSKSMSKPKPKPKPKSKPNSKRPQAAFGTRSVRPATRK